MNSHLCRQLLQFGSIGFVRFTMPESVPENFDALRILETSETPEVLRLLSSGSNRNELLRTLADQAGIPIETTRRFTIPHGDAASELALHRLDGETFMLLVPESPGPDSLLQPGSRIPAASLGHFESLAAQAPIGVAIINEEGWIIYANQALATISGAPSLETLLTINLYQSPRLSMIDVRSMAQQSLKSGGLSTQTFRIVTTWNKVAWLRLHVKPIHAPGEGTHFQVLIDDVTALHETKENAERLSKAKSTILAGVSHDLRTPMHALIGYTHLLEDTFLSSEQLDYIEQIKLSTNLVMETLESILDISRFESGQMELDIKEFNLQDVLRHAVEPFTLLARNKQLRFRTALSAETDRRVLGDPLKIKQILNNLISNAIKFTPEGSVTVSTALQLNAGARPVLKLDVADTGIGIPDASLPHIFEPFTQGELDRELKSQGVGLGLTLVQSIVNLQGGTLQLESEVDRGTRISVTIPLDMPEATADSGMIRGRSVLVIAADDKTPPGYAALEASGASLHHIAHRGDAINQLLNHQYDLCLFHGCEAERDGTYLNMLRITAETQRTPLLVHSLLLDGYDHLFSESFPMHAYSSKATDAQILDAAARLLKSRLSAEMDASESLHAKVLVVEDSEISRKLIKKMLDSSRLQSHTVISGEEALAACLSSSYDIILMDCELPGIDGFETTRRIRQMDLTRQPVIIAMTAHALTGDDIRCMESGMDDYMSKPIDRILLIGRIRHWLSQSRMDIFRNQVEHFAMASGLDMDFSEELIRDFVLSAERSALAIRRALRNEDTKQAGDLLHQLKGSAGNVRSHSIAYYAKKAEQALIQGDLDQTSDNLDNIINFVNRMKEGTR